MMKEEAHTIQIATARAKVNLIKYKNEAVHTVLFLIVAALILMELYGTIK